MTARKKTESAEPRIGAAARDKPEEGPGNRGIATIAAAAVRDKPKGGPGSGGIATIAAAAVRDKPEEGPGSKGTAAIIGTEAVIITEAVTAADNEADIEAVTEADTIIEADTKAGEMPARAIKMLDRLVQLDPSGKRRFFSASFAVNRENPDSS